MIYLSIGVFIATLIFVIWQPRGLSIGWSAFGGAVLALLLHIVTFSDVFVVTSIVWDATLAFVGIIIFSTVLDRIGFFEWAALKMAVAAKGDGRKVFFFVILLGAIVSAFFANDGAALILTPIVLEKVKLLKFDTKKMLPFIMASGFIADTTSLPFVTSNLVNIVSADYFHLGFVTYLLHMVIPDLVSLCASMLFLYIFFRRDIPTSYNPGDLPDPRHAIVHEGMFKASWVILVILLFGYILTELLHIPVSSVAGLIAIVFLIAGARANVIQPWRVIKDAPWAIVVFSIGMYVVVYGLKNAGLTALLGHVIRASTHGGLFAGTLATGFIAALLSSVMNNMPTVMIDALAIHASGVTGVMQHALIYANVIGCDLGPKITPIGSLATLLWLHVLRQKGITIRWGNYFRTGLLLTVPTLFVTLSGLYAWSLFIH
ncbi:arsenic transporter [Ferroacidibacillus organovorans]|uniref:Arsenical pump membrane protein n=1 Tax=Ferroacidibacillus organovorans TaxID=1765683 RepID=A0A162S8S1_9BACL|nr:arsenic transporter [Ferroacidibacillus organovorans]KYP79618.1 arsenic transporter [Ferroacidibacillus organovorans]OAG92746.1 arsenic transporter [Ferroacidibacillus organovorans]OPG16368.1 arsenical efflux pump membrane protein ArsB [Ferroacidibacillus organovorans]